MHNNALLLEKPEASSCAGRRLPNRHVLQECRFYLWGRWLNVLQRSSHLGHLPAFIGTSHAGLCAVLTVLHLMFGTFVAAHLAYLSTGRTDLLRRFAGSSHHRSGKCADFRAINIQCDALGHCLYLLLLKARRCAVITCLRTLVASGDARRKLLMGH